MKQLGMALLIALTFSSPVFAEVSFETYKAVITPSVPQGFTFDTQNKHMMQIQYLGHAAQMDVLKYVLHERQKDFSEMDKMLGATPWEWQGHSAIFIDGAQTGMSVVAIKLKNHSGILYVNHRVFGAAPLTLEQLKGVLAKIDLKSLEG